MNRLLIVDDEKISREYFKYVLRRENIKVNIDEAHDGLTAIEKVRLFKPDLIFMDIKMSEMDGLKATEEIKKDWPWVKIIILTAYDEFKYAQRAIKLGADDYLLKPIAPNTLLETINNNLKKSDERKQSTRSTTDMISFESKFVEYIKVEDKEGALNAVEEMFDNYLLSITDIVQVKNYLIEILGVIIRSLFFDEMTMKKAILVKDSSQKEILKEDNMVSIKNILIKFVKDILDVLKEYKMTPNERQIYISKRYIDKNIDKKIYLKDISDYVGFSPYYFSKLFKKIEGVNLSEYLNITRINKAVEYMENYQLTLKEISEKVGFEDFSYFSVMFKKYKNCMPSRYRKKIMERKQKNQNI